MARNQRGKKNTLPRVMRPRIVNVGDEDEGTGDELDASASCETHEVIHSILPDHGQKEVSSHTGAMRAMEDPSWFSSASLTSVIRPYVYHL